MSLFQTLSAPDGRRADYWRVAQLNLSFSGSDSRVVLHGYVNQAKKEEGTDLHILTRGYPIPPADAYALINTVQSDPSVTLYDALYGWITGQNDFDGATTDLSDLPHLENAPPEWETQVEYEVGDKVFYDGDAWETIQAHTSQANWTPPNVPALFNRIQ